MEGQTTRKARMSDVAQLAGVATMTVSRVLNESAPVTEEVRLRVMEAVRKLNYRPNPVARSLRRARSNSIGIIVPNFYDPFFAACAHAVSVVAKQHGYIVNVTTSDENTDAEYREASLMQLNQVEGLVVIPGADGESRLNTPEFASTPIVAVDRPIRGKSISSVLVENGHGAELAVSHLIGHGHRNIAYLALSDHLFTLKARYEGYRKTMKAAGLVPGEFHNCLTEENTVEVVRRLIASDERPTAIFSGNNLTTRHVLCALSRLKLRLSKDVALVGFDDFEMADIFKPAITVVRQPASELGRVAAEMLIERLHERNGSGNGSAAPALKTFRVKQRVLPVEFIVRESCGCPASR